MQRNRVLLLAWVAMAGVMMGGLAEAQQDSGRRGGGRRAGMMGRGGGTGFLLRLLRIEKIQKELGLLDVQVEEVEALAEESGREAREFFAGVQDLEGEERRARMREIMEKFRESAPEREKKLSKQLEEILVEEGQMKRLKQISMQVQGARALQNPEVLKSLNITDAQKKQFQTLREEIGAQMRERFQNSRDMSPEDRRAAMEEIGKDVEKKVNDVLTEVQKTKLEELRGEEFEFDRSQLWQRRGGRGRDQGRNRDR